MTDENKSEKKSQTFFMVNHKENSGARFYESTFSHAWNWQDAPPDWKPEDGLPESASETDVILIFSKRHKEREIRKLCERIRTIPALQGIPLLVAVTQYEMPLANRVKELPKTDYVFTPIEEDDLIERLGRLQGPSGT